MADQLGEIVQRFKESLLFSPFFHRFFLTMAEGVFFAFDADMHFRAGHQDEQAVLFVQSEKQCLQIIG